MTEFLQERWKQLYAHDLPTLARSKAPSQPHWPVHLDHCFARIILDAVIGRRTSSAPNAAPVPWTAKLTSPAIKNMTAEQLSACIALGEAIASGETDLAALNKQSLSSRNKTKNAAPKRKREEEDKENTTTNIQAPPPSKKRNPLPPTTTTTQPDIRTALGLPTPPHASPPPPQTPAATISPALASAITTHPILTPHQRRVLLALCQVPPGHYTTYLALSTHLHSSPRAVGNALRRNPFAPRVPCHRVVAAGGGIGGFGGGWGVGGEFCGEKVRLLRGEGVVVEEGGARVKGRVWEGFV